MATIIFKPTEKCNSSCLYCDVVANREPLTMKYDILELVYFRINEFLETNKNETIHLIWHGGEPLLLGKKFYKKSIEYQKKYCAKTEDRITHAIQSNLTLLNKEFIDILKQLNITSVGTSYEIIDGIRGNGSTLNSQVYNKRFFDAVNLLEENNIGWGCIYVVTKRNLEKPLDIFYHLANLKPDKGFNMNPVLIYGEDRYNLAITPVEFADFLGEIFTVWWKHRRRYPDIEPIKRFVKNIEEKDKGLSLGCVDSGSCAYNHINIDPLGETSHCGRSADWNIIFYGNIRDKTLHEVLYDPRRKEFLDRNEILPKDECKGCKIWGICHGGCPLDAFSVHGSFLHKTSWCDANKVFVDKYLEPITGYKVDFYNKN